MMSFVLATTFLIETTAAQNEVVLRYYRVRGLYFLAVVFVTTIGKVAHTLKKDIL